MKEEFKEEFIEMIAVEYPATGEIFYFSQKEIDNQIKIENSFEAFWPTIKPALFASILVFGSFFLFQMGIPPAFATEIKQKGKKILENAGNQIISNNGFTPTKNNPFPGGYVFDFRKKVTSVKKVPAANLNQNFIRIFPFLELKILKEPFLLNSTETSVLVNNFLQKQKKVASYNIQKNVAFSTSNGVSSIVRINPHFSHFYLDYNQNILLRGGFLGVGYGTLKTGKWIFDKIFKEKIINDIFKSDEQKQKEERDKKFHIPNLPSELFVFIPLAFLLAFLIRDNKLPKPVEQVLVKTGLLPKQTFFGKVKQGISNTAKTLVSPRQPFLYVLLLFLIGFFYFNKQELFAFLKSAGENNPLVILIMEILKIPAFFKLPEFLQDIVFPDLEKDLDSPLQVDNDPKYKALGGSDF